MKMKNLSQVQVQWPFTHSLSLLLVSASHAINKMSTMSSRPRAQHVFRSDEEIQSRVSRCVRKEETRESATVKCFCDLKWNERDVGKLGDMHWSSCRIMRPTTPSTAINRARSCPYNHNPQHDIAHIFSVDLGKALKPSCRTWWMENQQRRHAEAFSHSIKLC